LLPIPGSTPFPYTTLFRSAMALLQENAEAAERLVQTGTADLSYSLPSRARFRVNIFQQRGVYSIVMRVIPTDIPTLAALSLPEQDRKSTRLNSSHEWISYA